MNNTQDKPRKGKWSLRLFHHIVGTDKVWTSVFYDTFGSTKDAEEFGEELCKVSKTVKSYAPF